MPTILGQTVTTPVDELVDITRVTPWDIVWALLLVFGGVLAASLLRRFIRSRFKESRIDPGLVNLLVKISGWIVIVVAVVFALPLVGVDVTPLYLILILVAAVTVVSGRTLMENYGAGVVLQAEANFGPGDQIVTTGHAGEVMEVSSRIVKLRTLDGRTVAVPNATVMANPLEVVTTRPTRRSELVVGLQYGTDLNRARKVLRRAAQKADGVVDAPPVEVHTSLFGDSSIDFLVWYWHESDMQSGYEVTDSVARSINQACADEGLTIAFPQRTLWWGAPAEPDDLTYNDLS